MYKKGLKEIVIENNRSEVKLIISKHYGDDCGGIILDYIKKESG